MKFIRSILLLSLTLLFLQQSIQAQIDARMLQFPDVSKTHIVFSYGGDIWMVTKEGGAAVKISSPKGEEKFPRFSPDGSQIAYNANYDGNMDIYVIPSTGGVPERVTHHDLDDNLIDWVPDGKSLLYASTMKSGKQRFSQFYTVSSKGGLPTQLPIPYASFGSFSADAKKIAFVSRTSAFRTWKRYRGGMNADISIFNLENNASEIIIKNDAGNEFPMWCGNKVYFISDRGTEKRFNIWRYDINSKQLKQITNFKDYDIHTPSLGPDDIVFEQGGKIYLLNLALEKTIEVKVKVFTDQMSLMPKTVSVKNLIQNSSISPDGKRAVFEARGELFSVPAQNGPIFNFTKSSGIAERFPAWSPDGKQIAYWSDRTGEYELTVRSTSNPDLEKTLTDLGPGFRYNLFWSPDSKMIAFIDKAMAIYLYNFQTNKISKVDKALYFMQNSLQNFSVSWSPDSRWITYSRDLLNKNEAVFLYDTKEGKNFQLTSGFYSDADPVFDPDGKYIYFLTNRSLSPVFGDFDNTSIYPNTTNIAAMTLSEDILSPFSPKVDSVMIKKEETKKEAVAIKEKSNETKINIDDIERRVFVLPMAAGNISALKAVSGKIVYLRLPNAGSTIRKSPVMYFDFDKLEEKTIFDDAADYDLSADRKKLLVVKGQNYSIIDVADNQKMDKIMPTVQLEMTVDPKAEWKQIFKDSWRLCRDYFYDENMHGVNWNELRTHYGKLIDNCVTRADVNFVIGELISELNSSHTYRGGGDTEEAEFKNVGYLGIDWEISDGVYRINKIIRGAKWDTEVQSPLLMPGLNVKEGDYILSVNGESISTSIDPWAAFQGLGGKTVELTINNKPSLEGARKIYVKTLDDETRLRNLAWIESNRKYVDEASGGKLGYIFVPNTGRDGQTELVRQFSGQLDKAGLIIDERFNDGGQTPDRFIELLNRKPLSFSAIRDGANQQIPSHANFGPKAMLINGWSGSGGDAFPDYFRKTGMGPLIGERTWGGLIGVTGAPSLIDGGFVRVPSVRMFDADGKWFKEGHGVDPDIEVKDDPSQLAKGIDLQLNRAIQEVMNQLKKNPNVKPKHADYEKR